MGWTKEEVDKYVAKVERNMNTTREKNLKGFAFARLYREARDNDKARRHLEAYISVNESDFRGHRMMGQLFEETGNLEKALASYRRSLDLNNTQHDLVLKVVELYCKVPVDPDRARAWADRAARLYPGHSAVFKLRMHLLESMGKIDYEQMEDLISEEMAKRPKDAELHIRLVRVFITTGRLVEAFSHCVSVVRIKAFTDSQEWWVCAADVFEKYLAGQEKMVPADRDVGIGHAVLESHAHLLAALAHLLSLHLKTAEIRECVNALYRLDHCLYMAYQRRIRQSPRAVSSKKSEWEVVLLEMRGQLYMHCGTLIFRLAKEHYLTWPRALKLACTCYSTSTQIPESETNTPWVARAPKNKDPLRWYHMACSRLSQSGHLLTTVKCKYGEDWLETCISDWCSQQGQDEILNTIYGNQRDLSRSKLAEDEDFFNPELILPSVEQLVKYDEVCVGDNPRNLELITWIGLHWYQCEGNVRPGGVLVSRLFDGLRMDVPNIEQTAADSLCLRDLEAFLYAVVRTSAARVLEDHDVYIPNCQPQLLPQPLCTPLTMPVQEQWWIAAYNLYAGAASISHAGKVRATVQRGLEVIRALGNHGLHVRLLIYLATSFADKAMYLKTTGVSPWYYEEHWKSLQVRSLHYWREALTLLEKLERNESIPVQKDPLFPQLQDSLQKIDVTFNLQKARITLGEAAVRDGRIEEAMEMFEQVKTPQGIWNLAQIYKYLANVEAQAAASEELDVGTQSNGPAQEYYSCLNKARELLLVCREKVTNEERRRQTIQDELNEIEDMLNEDPNRIPAHPRKQLDFRQLDYQASRSSTTVSDAQDSEDNFWLDQPQDSSTKDLIAKLSEVTLNNGYLQEQMAIRDERLHDLNDKVKNLEAQLQEMKQMIPPPSTSTPSRLAFHLSPSMHATPATNAGPGNQGIQLTLDASLTPTNLRHVTPQNGQLDASDTLQSTPIAKPSIKSRLGVASKPKPAPPEFPKIDSSFFAGLSKINSPERRGEPEENEDDGQSEDSSVRHDSTSMDDGIHFEPIIPLPAKIDITTGEENEEVLFSKRAKLYRFDMKETVWKERGLGNMKILHGVELDKFRILMRREHTLKICANHLITLDMELKVQTKNSWVWTTVADFADETPKVEQLAVRFKMQEEAAEFEKVFEDCKGRIKGGKLGGAGSQKTASSPARLEKKAPECLLGTFAPKPGSWSCSICLVNNDSSTTVCVACGAAKITQQSPPRLTTAVMGTPTTAFSFGLPSPVTGTSNANKNYEFAFGLPNTNDSLQQVKPELDSTVNAGGFTFGSTLPQFAPREDTHAKAGFNIEPKFPSGVQPSTISKVGASNGNEDSRLGPEFVFVLEPGATASSAPFQFSIGQTEAPTFALAPFGVSAATNTTSLPASSTSTTASIGFTFGASKSDNSGWATPSTGSSTPIFGGSVTEQEPKQLTFGSLPGGASPGFDLDDTQCGDISTTSTQTDPHVCKKCKSVVGSSSKHEATETMHEGDSTVSMPASQPKSHVVPPVASSAITPQLFWHQNLQDKFMFGNLHKTEPLAGMSPACGKPNIWYPASMALSDIASAAKASQGSAIAASTSTLVTKGQGPSMSQFVIPSSEGTKPQYGTDKPFESLTVETGRSSIALNQGPEPSEMLRLLQGKPLLAKETTPYIVTEPPQGMTSALSSYGSSTSNYIVEEYDSTIQRTDVAYEKVEGEYESETDTDSEESENYTSSEEGDFSTDVHFTSPSSTLPYQIATVALQPNQSAVQQAPDMLRPGLESTASRVSEGIVPSSHFVQQPAVTGRKFLTARSPLRTGKKEDCVIIYEIRAAKADRDNASRLLLPPNFFNYARAEICPGCLGCNVLELITPSQIGSGKENAVNKQMEDTKKQIKSHKQETGDQEVPSFSKVKESKEQGESGENIFGSSSGFANLTFASISSPSKETVRKHSGPKEFPFAGQPLFGSKVTDEEQPDINFKPVIPLPDLIEIVTGEENHDVLFSERARLFRFDVANSMWKERGVGDIKLLRDRKSGRGRIVMRRDQIHKLCANHWITPDMVLNPNLGSDRSWVWQTQADFSDESPSPEQLAVRFKTSEFAAKFKDTFDALKTVLPNNSEDDEAKDDLSLGTEAVVPASELDAKFAPPPGSWICSECYLPNAATDSHCQACENEKPGGVSEKRSVAPSKDFAAASIGTSSMPSFVFQTPAIEMPEETATKDQARAGNDSFTSKPLFTIGRESLIDEALDDEELGLSPSKNSLLKSPVKSTTPVKSTPPSLSGFAFGSKTQSEFTFRLELSPSNTLPQTSPIKSPQTPTSPSSPGLYTESDDDGIHFEPVIPLPKKVDIKTGEEDEKPLFCQRAKLYRYDKQSNQWKERGLGEIKILKNLQTGRSRVLMRREHVLKVCANHQITPEMDLKPNSGSDRSWVWHVLADFADEVAKEESLAVRFKTTEIAQEFKGEFENAKNAVSLGKPGKNEGKDTEGKQDLEDRNSARETEQFLQALSPKDPCVVYEKDATCAQKEKAEQLQLPKQFFAGEKKDSGSHEPENKQPQRPKEKFQMDNSSSLPEGDSRTTQKHPAQPASGFLFGSSDITSMSFVSVASGLQTSPFGKGKDQKSPGFVGSGSQLFSPRSEENELEGKRPEEEGNGPHFEPLIPLPDKITAKTGEEDEEVLFSHRAKLYRYAQSSQQWKERGLGDIKILSHKKSGRVRILMRREQVLKICANHFITPQMKLQPNAGSERSWVWSTLADFSEQEIKPEQLAVRFKLENTAAKFKQTFEECKEILKCQINEEQTQDSESKEEKTRGEASVVNTKQDEQSIQKPAFTFGANSSGFQFKFGISNQVPRVDKNIDSVNSNEEYATGEDRSSLMEKFKPKPGVWYCEICLVENKPESTSCAACKTSKPGATQDTKTAASSHLKFSFGTPIQQETTMDKFKPLPGTWDCEVCLVQNGPESASCAACQTSKPGATQDTKTAASSQPKFTFGAPQGSDFTFGFSEKTSNINEPSVIFGTQSDTKTAASSHPKFSFGTPIQQETTMDKFKPLPGTWDCEVCLVQNKPESASCPACQTPKPGATQDTKTAASSEPKFSFGTPIQQETTMDKFKPLPGTWDCEVCLVQNKPESASCPACQTPKPGATQDTKPTPSSQPKFTFGAPQGSDFTFGFSEKTSNVNEPSVVFGTQSVPSSDGKDEETYPEFQFGNSAFVFGTTTNSPVSFGHPVDSQIDNSTVKPTFSFGTPVAIGMSDEVETPSGSESDKEEDEGSDEDDANDVTATRGTPLKNTSLIEDSKDNVFIISAIEPTSEEIHRADVLLLPKGFYLYERTLSGDVKAKQPRQRGESFETKQQEQFSADTLSKDSKGVFGASSIQSCSSFSDVTSGLSFLTKGRSPGFAGQGSQLFGSRQSSRDGGDNPENENDGVYFRPLVSLAEVEVVTGEENEEALFSQRAKLYRYDKDSSQWKERGIGEIKLLKHKGDIKFRVVMRREQIHKLCANHNITADMKLFPNSGSDRSWVWNTLADLSEDVPKAEQLAVKFKSVPIAQQFKQVFEECQQSLKEKESTRNVREIAAVFETGDKVLPSMSIAIGKQLSFGSEVFAMGAKTNDKTKKWKCANCEMFNNPEYQKCFGCNQVRRALQKTGTLSIIQDLSEKWECGTCNVHNEQDISDCAACGTKKDQSDPASKGQEKSDDSVDGGAQALEDSNKSDVKEEHPGESLAKSDSNEESSTGNFLFGSPSVSSLSFSGLSSHSFGPGFFGKKSSSKPDMENPDEKSADAEKDDSKVKDEGDDVSCHNTSGDHIHFEPIIPLPDEVKTVTGEEEEEEIFKERAKLYRYDKTTMTWKDRGLGDMKLLHNAETGRSRIVMRREQIHKLCANHLITADMELKPNAGSDRSWVWQTLADLSEEEAKPEQLAVRFRSAETAVEFKKKFDACRDGSLPLSSTGKKDEGPEKPHEEHEPSSLVEKVEPSKKPAAEIPKQLQEPGGNKCEDVEESPRPLSDSVVSQDTVPPPAIKVLAVPSPSITSDPGVSGFGLVSSSTEQDIESRSKSSSVPFQSSSASATQTIEVSGNQTVCEQKTEQQAIQMRKIETHTVTSSGDVTGVPSCSPDITKLLEGIQDSSKTADDEK